MKILDLIVVINLYHNTQMYVEENSLFLAASIILYFFM